MSFVRPNYAYMGLWVEMWILVIGLTLVCVGDYNITFFMIILWISYISPFVWGATNTSGQKEKCKIPNSFSP